MLRAARGIAGRWRAKWRARTARRGMHAALPGDLKRPLRFEELRARNLSRNQEYAFFDYFYCRFLPAEFVRHRRYFQQERRGFGEDAFHPMWYVLFDRFRFRRVLEIGVYQGQVVTLWGLLARHLGYACEVHALSPFVEQGDSVSRYEKRDYLEDLANHSAFFGLPLPMLCRSHSTSPEAEDYVASRSWDLIYIDGNHDYEVALHDWRLSGRAVRTGGLVVMDDAALGTDFSPPVFASAGHPGPSRVVNEAGLSEFAEIMGVGHNRVFMKV